MYQHGAVKTLLAQKFGDKGAMNRLPVDSSNIAEVGYDEQFATLELMFRDGRVYQYFDVPKSVHEDLMGAASIGKYFQSCIRGVFRYARV